MLSETLRIYKLPKISTTLNRYGDMEKEQEAWDKVVGQTLYAKSLLVEKPFKKLKVKAVRRSTNPLPEEELIKGFDFVFRALIHKGFIDHTSTLDIDYGWEDPKKQRTHVILEINEFE